MFFKLSILNYEFVRVMCVQSSVYKIRLLVIGDRLKRIQWTTRAGKLNKLVSLHIKMFYKEDILRMRRKNKVGFSRKCDRVATCLCVSLSKEDISVASANVG